MTPDYLTLLLSGNEKKKKLPAQFRKAVAKEGNANRGGEYQNQNEELRNERDIASTIAVLPL